MNLFGVSAFLEKEKKRVKLALPVLSLGKKKEADSASANTAVLTKTSEGGPGSGRHANGQRVVHPYHGKGTYIKPNERPGQSIVVFDKDKPLYDRGMSRGHVVSNDLIKHDTQKQSKESNGALNIVAQFLENSNPTPKPTFETVGPYVFKVVLIEEGMGNQVDGFYYSKEVLQAAAPLFEGKKIYADHPDKIEEESRPERTVKDVVGHFENVRFEINEASGLGCLLADAVTLPDEPYRWVRALMRHAVDYSAKYPDKLFIGLSINAGGDASPVGIKEFLASGKVAGAAKPKVQAAIEKGAETIRVVNQIQSVVSTDLVTEPGAGGRVLAILESEKGNEMKKKEDAVPSEKDADKAKPAGAADDKKEAPAGEKKDAAAPDAEAPHADEDQDRALIADMLKKALGSDVEVSEDAMLAAKEAYDGYKEMGYKEEDAMQQASHSMKLAHHMAKKKESKVEQEEAAKDEMPKDKECKEAGDKDEHKESAEVLRLRGENTRLKESLSARDLTDYIDGRLAESKLGRKVTDKIREATKSAKSKKDFDRHMEIFMEGYKQAEAGVSQSTSLLFLEKEDTTEITEGSSAVLVDCVKEY